MTNVPLDAMMSRKPTYKCLMNSDGQSARDYLGYSTARNQKTISSITRMTRLGALAPTQTNYQDLVFSGSRSTLFVVRIAACIQNNHVLPNPILHSSFMGMICQNCWSVRTTMRCNLHPSMSNNHRFEVNLKVKLVWVLQCPSRFRHWSTFVQYLFG